MSSSFTKSSVMGYGECLSFLFFWGGGWHVFVPLASQDLRTVTMKVLFLLYLTTAKHVCELQL